MTFFYCADGLEKEIFKNLSPDDTHSRSKSLAPPRPPRLSRYFAATFVIVTSSQVWNPGSAVQASRRRGLASVGVEPLHVVVLPSSKAAATGGGAPGPWHGGAPVGGRLLAGVREALSKATQVLPVTCILTIGEVWLSCRGLAHVRGGLRWRRWESQRCCPGGGRWRRNPRRGKLVWRWRWRPVAKTELWRGTIALREALGRGKASRRGGYDVGGERWGWRGGSSSCRGRSIATNRLSCRHPHSLRAVSLLPRGRGLACPAIGSVGHDPAPPLAGTWLSRRLALAVARLSSFNFHFFAHDVVKMHVDSLVH